VDHRCRLIPSHNENTMVWRWPSPCTARTMTHSLDEGDSLCLSCLGRRLAALPRVRAARLNGKRGDVSEADAEPRVPVAVARMTFRGRFRRQWHTLARHRQFFVRSSSEEETRTSQVPAVNILRQVGKLDVQHQSCAGFGALVRSPRTENGLDGRSHRHPWPAPEMQALCYPPPST